jgi:hypothetical protein
MKTKNNVYNKIKSIAHIRLNKNLFEKKHQF